MTEIRSASHDSVRTGLWVLLILSVLGNVAASFGGPHITAHVTLGLATAASMAALFATRRRG